MTSRTFILGIDSASFDVIDPLIDAGRMPNLQKVIRRGARSTLRSTVPPRTGPAWVSLMTGTGPGRHGVLDFWETRFDGYDVVHGRIETSGKYAGTTFFDTLAASGARVASLFVPMTFPAWDINGVMVAGPPTVPDSLEGFCHPVGVDQELGITRDVHIHPRSLGGKVDTEECLADLYRMDRERFTVARQVWETGEHACVMVVLEAVDIIQHTFWRYRGRTGHPFEDAVNRSYTNIDELLGDFLAQLPESDHLLVVSDHGMAAHPPRVFNTNAWLASTDQLTFDRTAARQRDHWVRLQKAVRRVIPRKLYNRLLAAGKQEDGALRKLRDNVTGLGAINWSETRAFRVPLPDPPCEGIRLNLEGREPKGVVVAEDAAPLLAKLTESLGSLCDPDGAPVVRAVRTRDDVYPESDGNNVPDLLLELHDEFKAGAGLTDLFGRTPQVDIDSQSGTHSPRGIIVAAGPAFEPGVVWTERLEIPAFASVLLRALERPVPAQMTPSPDALFRGAFQQGRRDDSKAVATRAADRDLTTQEVSEIEKKLENLGYL